MPAAPLCRLLCSISVILLMTGCYAPAPGKFELHAPADASSDVEVTVTLYELPADEQVSQSVYSLAPGESTSVNGFEADVDYRVELVVDNSTVWSDRIVAQEFIALQVSPNGTVRDIGGGMYEDTDNETTTEQKNLRAA